MFALLSFLSCLVTSMGAPDTEPPPERMVVRVSLAPEGTKPVLFVLPHPAFESLKGGTSPYTLDTDKTSMALVVYFRAQGHTYATVRCTWLRNATPPITATVEVVSEWPFTVGSPESTFLVNGTDRPVSSPSGKHTFRLTPKAKPPAP